MCPLLLDTPRFCTPRRLQLLRLLAATEAPVEQTTEAPFSDMPVAFGYSTIKHATGAPVPQTTQASAADVPAYSIEHASDVLAVALATVAPSSGPYGAPSTQVSHNENKRRCMHNEDAANEYFAKGALVMQAARAQAKDVAQKMTQPTEAHAYNAVHLAPEVIEPVEQTTLGSPMPVDRDSSYPSGY